MQESMSKLTYEMNTMLIGQVKIFTTSHMTQFTA